MMPTPPKHPLLAAAALLLIAVPDESFAQDAPAALPPIHIAPERDPSRPRLRYGISGAFVFSFVPNDVYAFNPGVALDLGAQLGDRFGLYLHGEGTYIAFAFQGATYAMAEWTPIDPLSIATGVGYSAMQACCTFTWAGPSVPLLLSLNLGGRARDSISRAVFRLSLEGSAGIEPRRGELGWYTALLLGFARM